eukprot:CAMPEP_0185307684 /NCGR_PEP_ID=MMETSP1363-20130426/16922_1 /TAXON_ID=38817 /ORGANISM="Gephyrocapsa oceanica, Strain RCC1303" /LENGTH=208 /DNA_ID=CAMNT_0027905027 /DNA_START=123 /DNA_END=747 /DNA_ORIENTATION=-
MGVMSIGAARGEATPAAQQVVAHALPAAVPLVVACEVLASQPAEHAPHQLVWRVDAEGAVLRRHALAPAQQQLAAEPEPLAPQVAAQKEVVEPRAVEQRACVVAGAVGVPDGLGAAHEEEEVLLAAEGLGPSRGGPDPVRVLLRELRHQRREARVAPLATLLEPIPGRQLARHRPVDLARAREEELVDAVARRSRALARGRLNRRAAG